MDSLTIQDAAAAIDSARLKREQAWINSEQNYYDCTYQVALQAWDTAGENYNALVRKTYAQF